MVFGFDDMSGMFESILVVVIEIELLKLCFVIGEVVDKLNLDMVVKFKLFLFIGNCVYWSFKLSLLGELV